MRAVAYIVDNTKRFRQAMMISGLSVRRWNTNTDIVLITTGLPIHEELVKLLSPCKVFSFQEIFGSFPDDKVLIGYLKSYEEVAYLDADTVVLRDINKIFSAEGHIDVMARLSWTYQSSEWERLYQALWQDNLSKVGLPFNTPVLNTGVIVFRRYAHVRIFDLWKDINLRFKLGYLKPVYGGQRLSEQLAFSMAVSLAQMNLKLLSPREHTFAWSEEINDETIVYHTTSKWYDKFLDKLLAVEDGY